MASCILLFVATTLAIAPAMRSDEEDRELNRGHLLSVNQSLAEVDEQSGEVVLATWAAFNLAYDAYEFYDKTKKTWKSLKKRKEAVDKIVSGHTKGVGIIVEAANTELGSLKGGAKELQEVIEGDTFNHVKDLLKTFEMAQKMCIEEDHFFKDPVAWFTRFVGSARYTKEELTGLGRAKVVIERVVESLRNVIDEGMCPELKDVVKEDLLQAQRHVEEWEEAVMNVAHGPISYYEMMYARYAKEGGDDKISPWLLNVGTTLMDKASTLTQRHVEYPDRKTCYVTAAGKGGDIPQNGEYDPFEIEFDPTASDEEVRRHGDRLREISRAINMALDRASMNMEMFDRECKRVAPNGKADIIKELEKEAKAGNETSVKMFAAVSCDFCMRYGCREVAVLSLLHQAYRLSRYGIDKVIIKLAKTLRPQWLSKITKTVSAIEDVTSPEGDRAVEFFCSAMFLFAKATEEYKVGETCIEMGLVLAKDESVKDKLGELADGITPISKPKSTGKLQQVPDPGF